MVGPTGRRWTVRAWAEGAMSSLSVFVVIFEVQSLHLDPSLDFEPNAVVLRSGVEPGLLRIE